MYQPRPPGLRGRPGRGARAPAAGARGPPGAGAGAAGHRWRGRSHSGGEVSINTRY